LVGEKISEKFSSQKAPTVCLVKVKIFDVNMNILALHAQDMLKTSKLRTKTHYILMH